jgi:AraC-like DNA-binding protein
MGDKKEGGGKIIGGGYRLSSLGDICMMKISVDEFYKDISAAVTGNAVLRMPGDNRDNGHFNVFDLAAFAGKQPVMPYNRRTYYKISLIRGHNRAEYADKVIEIKENALLFATPRVPYHWVPLESEQAGSFCIFTADFLDKTKSGLVLDSLPIFQPGEVPIFQVSDAESIELQDIFKRIHKEMASDYAYKYDLLRNYVMELIHYGQKLQPVAVSNPVQNAATRVSSLFTELLERQFPVESQQQSLALRTAKDYADRLAVHVNHLNKVLKETTGHTTTQIIHDRILQEAKVLLKQTDWNVSEISYSLGFEEVAHFSNFFKKRTSVAPLAFRA